MSQRHFVAPDFPATRLSIEAIHLADDKQQTLQVRLSFAIVDALLRSRARPGTRLPSTRALADQLGISRMTVTLVYQELAAQGYLQPLARSGFVVADSMPNRRIPTAAPRSTTPSRDGPDWGDWLDHRPGRRRVIRKPANWRDYRWPFIFGQADPRLFNHNAWRDCARRALGTRDFGSLAADQHGQDDPMLVDYIISNSLPRRGIQASPDQVLVTLGAQNALYIATQLLTAPDRLAATEDPGYPDFAEALRGTGCPIHFARVDEHGLDPDDLPRQTRLVFTTPSHNIPTGATMPLARRHALLGRAERDGFLIIEDDYDFEMSYLAPPAPSLKSLDRSGRVIYLGSFSKSLFPGLRIGYMVAPAPFIARARELRAIILRHAPSHLQRITAYFLALGHYDAHVVRLRQALSRRRAAMEQALAQTPLRVAGAAQQGGSSLWVEAPGGPDSRALAASLARDGVLIEPGDVFFENPPQICRHFRLGYGSIASEDIPAGIALLARHAARQ